MLNGHVSYQALPSYWFSSNRVIKQKLDLSNDSVDNDLVLITKRLSDSEHDRFAEMYHVRITGYDDGSPFQPGVEARTMAHMLHEGGEMKTFKSRRHDLQVKRTSLSFGTLSLIMGLANQIYNVVFTIGGFLCEGH